MTRDKLYDEATQVSVKEGEIILDGPDSVDVKMTPEAAEKTADNLFVGVMKARGQKRLRKLPHKAK